MKGTFTERTELNFSLKYGVLCGDLGKKHDESVIFSNFF